MGDELQFNVYGSSYQLGDTYQVGLFNQPKNTIDGARVTIDLPWQLQTDSLFGLSPIRVLSVSPSSSITGRETEYLVQGQQLQLVEQLAFGDQTILAGQFSVNSAGTQLRFSATLATPGLKHCVHRNRTTHRKLCCLRRY